MVTQASSKYKALEKFCKRNLEIIILVLLYLVPRIIYFGVGNLIFTGIPDLVLRAFIRKTSLSNTQFIILITSNLLHKLF